MNEVINNEIIEETTETAPSVSYIVYESAQARAERTVKRLIGVIVLLIALLAATNMFWLYEWMQYDYVSTTETVEVDSGGGGHANYIKDGGEINNGESKSNQEDSITEETTE